MKLVMSRPEAVSSPDVFAEALASAYLTTVSTGFAFLNFSRLQRGNYDAMKAMFKLALLKGLTTQPPQRFSLVNELGEGVKIFWFGAQMTPFPVPIIPAPGAISNTAVTINVVTNTGTWPKFPPIFPARNVDIFLDQFIIASIIHLFSLQGIVQTLSLYPGPVSPIPGPGFLNWRGFVVLPVPGLPNIPLNVGPTTPDGKIEVTSGAGSTTTPTGGDVQIQNGNIIVDGVDMTSPITETLPFELRTPQTLEILEKLQRNQPKEVKFCE
jgi:hypothetical protein